MTHPEIAEVEGRIAEMEFKLENLKALRNNLRCSNAMKKIREAALAMQVPLGCCRVSLPLDLGDILLKYPDIVLTDAGVFTGTGIRAQYRPAKGNAVDICFTVAGEEP